MLFRSLGGMIPAGTGQHIHRSGKRNGIDPRIGNRNLFSNKVKDILFHHDKVSFFFHSRKLSQYIKKTIKRVLRKRFIFMFMNISSIIGRI